MEKEKHNQRSEPEFRKPAPAHRLIEKRRKNAAGAVYAVYGSRPGIPSTDETSTESNERAYVVRQSGQIMVGGLQREAEQGDIFILPSPAAEPPLSMSIENPFRIDAWALFAVLVVLSTLIRLFFPIF